MVKRDNKTYLLTRAKHRLKHLVNSVENVYSPKNVEDNGRSVCVKSGAAAGI